MTKFDVSIIGRTSPPNQNVEWVVYSEIHEQIHAAKQHLRKYNMFTNRIGWANQSVMVPRLLYVYTCWIVFNVFQSPEISPMQLISLSEAENLVADLDTGDFLESPTFRQNIREWISTVNATKILLLTYKPTKLVKILFSLLIIIKTSSQTLRVRWVGRRKEDI